ncbi:hypothetical protein HOT45_gp06 [Gordonia phage Trine]|uniref:Uncharacterized protein n=1 Tax=Gordonia phage Trine TaxID=2201431 RepID=A0A2Z4QAI2_9CAUD|nr:hypothetical protein HOT45_gp06 [Gordonia phage Trine]AWY06508.1 hypothetical protein PBI_TRINE_6 [Gordonia phage Trine]
MADLKLYEYEVAGVLHTAQLTSEDAERLQAKEVRSARAPRTKAAKAPENKSA